MAIQAARLIAEVVADVAGAERDLGSFGSKVGKGLGGVGAAGAAAFAGVATAGAAIGGMGIKIASDMEQARIGFTTVLGSGQKADAFLQQLQQFAAKTPFEFPELQTAASRLLAVGTESKRVIPLMTVLGDATSAMGTGSEGINRAVTALTQMQQKGKVTAEEMMQLTEAGIPAWDALAASLGKTVPEAQKMVSQGLVPAEAAFSALESKAGTALQRVAGGMEKQAQSAAGMWATLKDTVSMGLADMAAPALQAVKGAMGPITQVLTDTMKAVGPALGNLFAGLVSLLQGLLPAVQPLLSVVANLAGTIGQALGPALQRLAPFLTIVAENLGGALTKAIEGIAPYLPELAEVLGGALVNILHPLGVLLATLAPVFGQLLGAVLPLIPPLTQLFQDVMLAIIPVVARVAESLVPLIQSLVGTSDKAGPLVKVLGILSDVLLAIPQRMLEWLVKGIMAFMAIGPVVSIIGSLAGVIGALGPVLLVLTGPVGLVIAAVAALAGIVYLVYRNWGTITSFFSGLWEKVKQVFMAGVNAVVGFFTALPGKVLGALAALPGLIGGAITDLVRGILTVWWTLYVEIPMTIIKAIPEVLGALWDMAGKVAGAVWDFIKGLPGLWWDGFMLVVRTVGEVVPALVNAYLGLLHRIATAVWEGLKALPRLVWDAAVAMGTNAIEGAKTLFTFFTNLPSNLFNAAKRLWDDMTTLGGNIVKGIWNGISGLGSWLWDKVWGWVKDVLPGPVKMALGIKSPSRVMAALGEQAGIGLANGVLGTSGKVSSAAGVLAGTIQGMVAGTEQGVYAIGQAMGALPEPALAALTAPAAGLVPPGLATGTTVNNHTHTWHVAGSVVTQQQLADEMRSLMLRVGERNSSTWGALA